MEESFAYLRDVLGVKYLPLTHARVTDGESVLYVAENPELIDIHTTSLESGFPVGAVANVDLSEPEEIIEQAIEGSVEAVSVHQPLENLSELRRQSDDLIETSDLDSAPVVDDAQTNPLQHRARMITDKTFSPVGAPSLESLKAGIAGCELCKLHKDRKNIIFGSGSMTARVMFIGEGPGSEEDVAGEPFIGPAGELLDKMILAMGLKREDVYLTHVVKCRPPQDRNSEFDERHECSPFLLAQIRLINPLVIVALGGQAAQTLLKTDKRLNQLRGEIHTMNGKFKVVATYHPLHLLKHPEEKKDAWQDLKFVMKELKANLSK